MEFEETSGSSTTVVRRRAILPEYFMELPPPTPQTGVAGVFITPYTGAYTHTVPGLEIAAARRLAVSGGAVSRGSTRVGVWKDSLMVTVTGNEIANRNRSERGNENRRCNPPEGAQLLRSGRGAEERE